MSSFEWSAPAARFEVFGVPCVVEIGDAEIFDRLQKTGEKLMGFNPAKGGQKAALAMSHELRGVVRAVVGDEAASRIFEGRKPNIAMEASMIAYIFEQINEASAEAEESVESAVARIAALNRPLGDEE